MHAMQTRANTMKRQRSHTNPTYPGLSLIHTHTHTITHRHNHTHTRTHTLFRNTPNPPPAFPLTSWLDDLRRRVRGRLDGGRGALRVAHHVLAEDGRVVPRHVRAPPLLPLRLDGLWEGHGVHAGDAALAGQQPVGLHVTWRGARRGQPRSIGGQVDGWAEGGASRI